MVRSIGTLELAGNVLCLDFANTVNSRLHHPAHDYLAGYEDLLQWSGHAGSLTQQAIRRLRPQAATTAAARALTQAHRLRDTIYAVFSKIAHGRPPRPADLDALSEAYRSAMGRSAITRLSRESQGEDHSATPGARQTSAAQSAARQRFAGEGEARQRADTNDQARQRVAPNDQARQRADTNDQARQRPDAYELSWPADATADPAAPLWPVSHSAGELLLDGPLDRVGECPGCGWLFLDTSRNGARRWCSMATCGSRDKMARYHRQHRKAETG